MSDGAFWKEDGDGALFFVEREDQIASPVFFARQRSQPLPLALADFGRVRAEGQRSV